MPTSAVSMQDRKHRPVLPKKCLYCERRFSKADHQKRHQRSHTGERPYKCSRCQKCFSRSDVLVRHLKNHPQLVGEDDEHSSLNRDPGQTNGHKRRPSTSIVASAVNATQMTDPCLSNNPEIQTYPTSPSKIDPALLGPLGDYVDQSSTHTASPGLDHLASLASQQPWGDGTVIDTAATEAERANLAANDRHGWGQDSSSQHQDFHAVSAYLQTPSSSKQGQPQEERN